ncbi:GH92 family glycosyl hydrolase [Sphingomonas mollis]|uniref:GH92 family glycosyl hydrolase n=1 Tax=Sphingomonas mollis TaxID=2795726 RepID=A0ABS0XN48_9SPHN|nr:GH92 family glycosyl hydrolase [Sphingomonas sp. BT553]MBJ6121467.1 GH92 family glycosyl hydrolase [Sphingomonas sp. BT553]
MSRASIPSLRAAALAGLLLSASGVAAPADTPLYRYVDPLVGTGNDDQGDTVPGPTLPAGSIHPSPETLTGSNAGYDPAAPLSGFAQLHTQGSGGRTTYGTFLVSPQTGEPQFDEAQHLSPKADEAAAADRYAVTLSRYGIKAEVTPAANAALYRFAYPTGTPAGAPATMVFDITRKIRGELGSAGADVTLDPVRGRIVGRVRTKDYWNPANVDIWFVAQLDRTPTKWGIRNGDTVQAGATSASVPADTKLAAWWQFDAGKPVMMKMAVSFTSAERAAELLAEDIPGWDFDAVRRNAQTTWNRELSRVTIDGVGAADKRRFYTALYHTTIQPRDRTRDQAPADRATPHWDDYYTLWDTYHTGFPLMSLLRPSVYAGNAASIIRTFERFGAAHTAFIAGRNYHVGQGGDEVDNVLGEGLIRGVPNIDWKKAAEVSLHNAYEERRPRYLIDGYFGVGDKSPEPDNQRARSGSSTPAFALNDFYAGKLAAAAGKPDDAAALLKRAGNWRNVWNKDAASDGYTGFIIPRYPDGRFQNLDPKIGWDGKKYENVGFYEGTAWVYSYTMLHDLPGMIAAMGGRDRFVERLRHALDTNLIDITNEPSFATPWLFSDVGRPDLASYWANRIYQRFTPDAYPGDEDNGAMSSHYVFNRIGLFPKLTTDLFYLHAPHQPRSTIMLEDGKTFTITARNWKPGRIYIASATLDGRPLTTPFVRQADITGGGTLALTLADKPTTWGR